MSSSLSRRDGGIDAGDGASAAPASPGKRSLTEARGAVQRRAAQAPAGPATPATAGAEDPFALHLGAPVQAHGEGPDPAQAARTHEVAERGVSGGGGALPHLDRIQASFGRHDVSAVQAHVGGAAGDAAQAISADAYATGDKVAFRSQPDLFLAAHEAAHVVQQQGGVQLKGGVGQAHDVHEQHADQVATAVVEGRSAEPLLDAYGGGGGGGGGAVQRKEAADAEQDVGAAQDVDAGGDDGGGVAETAAGLAREQAAEQQQEGGEAGGGDAAGIDISGGGGVAPGAAPAGAAGVKPEVAAAVPALVAAAASAPPKKATWVDRARDYNQGNQGLVDQFNAATGNACVVEGVVDPNKVAHWQVEHHVAPDGRVGAATLAAAKPAGAANAPAGGAPAANAPAPAANAPAHPPVASAPTPAAADSGPAASAPAVATPAVAAAPPTSSPAAPSSAGPALPPAALQVLSTLAHDGADLLRAAEQMVQGAADALSSLFHSIFDAGPAVTPVAPATTPAAPAQAGPAPATTPAAPAAPAALGEPTRLVLSTGAQQCLVFVSPGGLTTPTPDIFVFLHGHMAQYGIDGAQKGKGGTKSGSDVAAEAMRHARGKNLISILPQGVIATGSVTTGKGKDAVTKRLAHDKEGGYMADLQAGLPAFLTNVLGQVAAQLQTGGLAPGRVSLAGHSAGGYQGMHDALRNAGALNITDLTMMDSNYSAAHFDDAAKWIFGGGPGKSLRIIGSADQMLGDKRATYTKKFGVGNLDTLAKAAGCSVVHLIKDGDKAKKDKQDQRDNKTLVLQHSQVHKDGAIQADVLMLMADRSHHQIRDDVMYDAMMSIGEGAAGSDKFGRAESVEAKAAAGGGGAEMPANGPAFPTPQHVDGHDGDGVEPIRPAGGGGASSAPATTPKPATPAPTQQQDVKADKAPTGTKAKLYGTGGHGGIIGVDQLSRHSDVTVKGKKIAIDLTDAEFDFKQRVYQAATARLGDKLYGGIPEDELQKFSGGKMRPAAYSALSSMLSAMRSDIAKGKAINGVEVAPDSGIEIGSTYRSPQQDFGLWDSGFNENYLWSTQKAREKKWPDDPFGAEAVKFMVSWIGERKAAPGGSNHSNGVAVDLKCKVNGSTVPNKFTNQVGWRASWQYQWLKENAASYQFKNYAAEAWHYDYRGPI